MKFFKLISLILAMSAVGATAHGQVFGFEMPDTDGWVNNGENAVNDGTNSASGYVNFLTGQVTIENTSTISSQITGIYILKPTTLDTWGEGSTLSTFPNHEVDWFASNADFNSSTGGLQNGGSFDQNTSADLYFGAQRQNGGGSVGIGSVPDLYNPLTFSFNFTFSGVENWNDYLTLASVNESPHVLIRWQTVENAVLTSSKGYGFFDVWDPDIPPPVQVPEPSEIAAIGFLGMLGLIWGRRRFLNRSKKQKK